MQIKILETLNRSLSSVVSNFGYFLLLYIIVFGSYFLIGFLLGFIIALAGASQEVILAVCYIVIGLLCPFMLIPLTYMSYCIAKGIPCRFKEKVGTLVTTYYFRYLGLLLLITFIVLIGIICLVLPGLYFGFKLILAPYFLIVRNDGIIDSLKNSYKATNRNFWRIVGLQLIILLLSLVVTMFISIFLYIPVVALLASIIIFLFDNVLINSLFFTSNANIYVQLVESA